MAKGKYQKWLTADGRTLLEAWARDGLTDEQIAHNCGVNVATLYDWKKRYPEISEALKKGKEVVDVEVENALLKRAKGFEYTETRIEESPKDGRKVTSTKKIVPPDVGAAAFWLKNRRPNIWRDHQEVEHSGSIDTGSQALISILRQLQEDDDDEDTGRGADGGSG